MIDQAEISQAGDASSANILRGAIPKPAITKAACLGRHVEVSWSDGRRGIFPAVWLRDNCVCDQCGDPTIGKRRLRIADIARDIAPRSAALLADGGLLVEWASDLHRSSYGADWLHYHCPSGEQPPARRAISGWDGSLAQALPQADAADIMKDPQSRLTFFRQLRDYGLTLVRDLKPEIGALEAFADTVGPLVETNFGRIFDIQFKPEQLSIANSTEALMPHTDEPYRYNPPGVIFFHCMEASADGGGVSIFVDGFGVAETLRQTQPDMFHLLTRVNVPYRRHYTGRVDVQASAPLISVNDYGEIEGVRFNDRVMAPLDLNTSGIEAFYEAFRALSDIYYDERRWCLVPLKAGNMMVFDNHRVLHGRTGFSKDIQKRYIRQCHVDRADLHSKFRILARSLGADDAEARFPGGSFA